MHELEQMHKCNAIYQTSRAIRQGDTQTQNYTVTELKSCKESKVQCYNIDKVCTFTRKVGNGPTFPGGDLSSNKQNMNENRHPPNHVVPV